MIFFKFESIIILIIINIGVVVWFGMIDISGLKKLDIVNKLVIIKVVNFVWLLVLIFVVDLI